jgi:hypothetical protein
MSQRQLSEQALAKRNYANFPTNCKAHEPPSERWYTAKDLCATLKVSPQTLWRMTCDGRIEPPVMISSRNRRWRPGVLERFAERAAVAEYAGRAAPK